MHIVSYEFLIKPEESAELVGSRNKNEAKIMPSNVSRLIRTLERHHGYGNDVNDTVEDHMLYLGFPAFKISAWKKML